MNLTAAVGAALGDSGTQVADVQRALLRLGYYGIRFAIDGAFGRNTLGAVLACKYDLVTVYRMKRRDIRYAPEEGNRASLIASGSVTALFADVVQTLHEGDAVGGVASWCVPSRAEVSDAGVDIPRVRQ